MGANLFQQYLQPVKSVADYSADMDRRDLLSMQMQGQQRQNAIAGLDMHGKVAAMRDAQADQQARRGVKYTTPDEYVAALRATGRPGLMKEADEREKSGADIRVKESTAQENKAKVVTAFLNAQGQLATQVVATPTREAAAAALMSTKRLAQHLGIPMDTAADEAALLQLQTPDDIKRHFAGQAMKASEMLAKMQTVNAGNAQVQQAVDPLTGAVRETGRTPIMQSPDNAAAVGASVENNKRTVAEQARGRDQTDAREWARINDSRQKQAWEMGGGNSGDDPSQAALIKKFGKPEAGRRWKTDGTLEAIPGGSADAKAQLGDMGKGSVNDVVASLRDMYNQLDDARAITNPDKGSLGNLSAGVASSGPGQVAGKLFGTQAQSLRNTVAQQRPLLLQAIMKATGMSAKQMDSNAELKLYLATATDPQLDVSANRRALDMIETLYGKPGGSRAPAAPAGPKPTVSNW